MKIDRNDFSDFFFSEKNFTYLIFSLDLSLWFHKTSKKVGSADIIFFFTDITFFFEFRILHGKSAKKKNDITFLRVISLLKLKCKACYQHKTMLSIPFQVKLGTKVSGITKTWTKSSNEI